ncbi:hypothetical protein ONZ51_g2793 [Trametes cubensis]|uniref:NADP-dependent oxidoreductase domain-containing protein n=1 Tax=Trametes cubensis TaxID=1111947 RepID=A0AAD7TYW5_9APHY|nr:hypothetical protein ONZ51_g2793 [Trametes cubensis]
MLGLLFNALFADSAIIALDGVNTSAAGGWLNHNWKQLYVQIAYIAACTAYSFVVTAAVARALDCVPTLHLRATPEEEMLGMDDAEIGEFASDYIEVRRDYLDWSPLYHAKSETESDMPPTTTTTKSAAAGATGVPAAGDRHGVPDADLGLGHGPDAVPMRTLNGHGHANGSGNGGEVNGEGERGRARADLGEGGGRQGRQGRGVIASIECSETKARMHETYQAWGNASRLDMNARPPRRRCKTSTFKAGLANARGHCIIINGGHQTLQTQQRHEHACDRRRAYGVPIISCWMGTPGEGEHVTAMVARALELGYRHIDTAANYGELFIEGNSGSPRSEVFVTTKLDQRDHGRVEEALDASLSKLGVEYVDLYLMHWPMACDESGKTLQPDESPTFVETWKAMEELFKTGGFPFSFHPICARAEGALALLGKAKAIGVSNFSIKTLTELLEHANVVPAVNQVELHPCLPQHDLLEFCTKRDILLTAYTPLGKAKFVNDPVIQEIVEAHGPRATGAQVLLSWGVQRGTAVIPKTLHPERLKENLDLKHLSAAEMDALDDFHKRPGMHRSMCGFHSPELGGSCFGWTYTQLGWELTLGGVHL